MSVCEIYGRKGSLMESLMGSLMGPIMVSYVRRPLEWTE